MRISDWSSDVCSSDLAEGLADSPAIARDYILKVIGERARVDLIDAYLDNGPEMVSWLAVNSEVVFLMSLPSSDWYPALPGAKHYGRVLSPREYDGKKLGSYFPKLTPGREEFNAPGGFLRDLFDLPYIPQSPTPKADR